MATRWAICGAGNISKDFCIVLNSFPKTEHQIVAVATASDASRAKIFASEHHISKSFGSYEELASQRDVDIVYIATIHPFHVDTSLLFINAGKNVLCEKPMAMSLEGCRKVLAAARDKNVFFLEGYWTRFFPLYRYLNEQIASGVLGDIKQVEAAFCAPISAVDRHQRWSLGGGGFLDIGVYPILISTFFFKGKPTVVKAEANISSEGVDWSGVILLKYGPDKLASLMYSTETANRNSSLTVRGTKGNAFIPDMCWCPEKLYLDGELREFPLPKISGNFVFTNSEGFCYEIECVRKCLLQGHKECPEGNFAETENMSYILQEVLNQFGIKYTSL